MKTQKQNGFTIIEVVLVLAIAGLIFLIVFLAVPALQRSQRDTQRRNDVGRFVAQVQNYTANTKGTVPTAATLATFVGDYLDNGAGKPDNWKDPVTGAVYAGSTTADVTSASVAGSYYYVTNATCNGDAIQTGAGARKVAIRMKLEGAGFYCQNN